MTSKQTSLLRELVEGGGVAEIFDSVTEAITTEWRQGEDAADREASYAKLMALRDVRREIRKLIGADDGGT